LEELDAAPTRPQPDEECTTQRSERGLLQGRHLGHRRFRRDLVQAPQKTAADQADDGECVEVGSAIGHAAWRRFTRRCHASETPAQSVPIIAPLACANGATAMSQPAGWRSVPCHGVSLSTLIARPANKAEATPRCSRLPATIRCTQATATPACSTPDSPP